MKDQTDKDLANKKKTLAEVLEKDNWKFMAPSKFKGEVNCSWYKQFPEVQPGCRLNDNGIQLVIEQFYMEKFKSSCYELSLTAEGKSGRWVNLKYYGMSEKELIDHLEAHSDQLIRAWEEINE